MLRGSSIKAVSREDFRTFHETELALVNDKVQLPGLRADRAWTSMRAGARTFD
jgi:hypothetical protein